MPSCRTRSERGQTPRRESSRKFELNRCFFTRRRTYEQRICALLLLCQVVALRSFAFQAIGPAGRGNNRLRPFRSSATGAASSRPESTRGRRLGRAARISGIIPSSAVPAEDLLERGFDSDDFEDGASGCYDSDPPLPDPPHLRGLNPSQIEAVTRPRRGAITRVVAGPGAGKTRVLTCRIAHLLCSNDDDDDHGGGGGGGGRDRILAVTFTKKAAGEMQHRLEALLREEEERRRIMAKETEALWSRDEEGSAFDAPDGEEVDGLIREEEVTAEEHGGTPPPRALSRVTLGTFHSVCARILRWNGAELSSLPSVADVVRSASSIPGEGSSTTASSVPLDGTFAIVDQSDQLRVVRENMKTLGIATKGDGKDGGGKGDIRPITILNAVSYLKSEAAYALVRDSRLLPPPSGDGSDKGEEGGRKISDKALKIASAVLPFYRRTLLAHNSLDFDDLILLAREMLLFKPEVRESLHRRWTHVLVDEFQDTSRAQLDVVRLLTTGSLFVVGDGDQSIYSWRGANAESMTDFAREFDGHDHGRIVAPDESREKEEDAESTEGLSVDTVYLMENYRSTTNIVRAAQKIISNGPPSQSPSSSAQAAIRKDMRPMRGKGPSPRVLACADAKAEASFVVKTIRGMINDGTLIPGESTVAIIYRTNAQSRALEEECVARNLPYLIRGNAGTFYSRAEIKDCMCFLRWLYNGRDRSAMLRAVKTPSRGIGDVAISEFLRYFDNVESFLEDNMIERRGPRPTPLDILISLSDGNARPRGIPPPGGHMSKRALNRFLPMSAQMKKIRSLATQQSVSALLSSIIKELELKTHFDSISKTSEEFADRWGNVMELLQAAARYSDDGPCLPRTDDGGSVADTPLGQFLDDVALLSDTESGESESDSDRRVVANLMTIHASKGMEFDAVFLVGNEEGTLPTHRSIQEGDDAVELEEERRLCYVAMTRAKTHLIMTWRREVMTFFGEGFRSSNPDRSRFLNALVSKKSEKTTKPSRRGTQNERGGKKSSVYTSREKGGILSTARRKKPTKTGAQKRGGPAVSNISSGGMEMRKGMPSFGPRPRRNNVARVQNSVDGWRAADASQLRPRQHSMQPSRTQDIPPRQHDSRAKDRAHPSFQRMRPKTRKEAPASPSGSAPAMPQMDSTMFFPVGSSVIHAVHGRGEVLQPPNVKSSDDNLLVRVEFDCGIEIDLPVLESGLRHVYKT